MASRSTIAEWRALAGTGSSRPRIVRGVSLQSTLVGEVPAEWLIPEGIDTNRVILYLHGGAWVLGWYNSHRLMVSRLAKAARARAFAVDYRLAPEHPFPAALEDSLATYHCLLELGIPPERMAFAGDSSGGNLVLAALLKLKSAGEPLPAAAVCLSPATNLAERGASFQANARKEAILPPKFSSAGRTAYTQDCDARDPLVSPIFGDLRGLPPLLIQAGADELLLSDATSFAEKARLASVDVTLEVYAGMWHVWQIYAPYLPEADQALRSVARFIDGHIS
jgi:epsilon-lactone hydrolase